MDDIEIYSRSNKVYVDLIGRKVKIYAKSYLAKVPVYLGVSVVAGDISLDVYYAHELVLYQKVGVS